tara:strand:- start:2320 stop:3531 length:1212 start_codon:yes stop_codon:yes gene_type:complete
MSINVNIPNKSYDFSELSLGEPTGLGNNLFFSKISNNGDIYIQTPEIKSKEGLVNNVKKPYIDLLLKNENEDIIEWFESLEEKLYDLIYLKKDEWFQDSNIEKTDIENIFISPLKSIKSGKQFVLRSYLDNPKSLISKREIKIYDESDNILTSDSIKSSSKIIALLHINGLKFSSKNFQIYIDIKEVMKTSDDKECKYIIKKITKSNKDNVDEISENKINMQDNNEEEKDEEEKNEKNENLENVENVSMSTISLENVEQSLDDEIKQEVKEEIKDEIENEIKQKLEEEVKEEIKEIKEEIKEDINNQLEDISNNITLDIDSNDNIKEYNVLENIDEGEKININIPSEEELEKYRLAVLNAKDARKKALEAYLHAKNIKAQCLFDLESESESDGSDDLELEELY